MYEITQKVLKEALFELASFINDGYILYSQLEGNSYYTRHWFLRHSRNTNRLHIVVRASGFLIIKNGRVVKNTMTTA